MLYACFTNPGLISEVCGTSKKLWDAGSQMTGQKERLLGWVLFAWLRQPVF